MPVGEVRLVRAEKSGECVRAQILCPHLPSLPLLYCCHWGWQYSPVCCRGGMLGLRGALGHMEGLEVTLAVAVRVWVGVVRAAGLPLPLAPPRAPRVGVLPPSREG